MYKRPKGTYDIYSNETRRWVELEKIIRNITKLYNYDEIRTPIFESSGVFHRDNNTTEDIVTKETYDFKDRGHRDMTLRPEGTAGTIRAYIENKLYADSDLTKLFYMGPIFRYENPQKGRQRQFHQFGIEALGSNSPYLDAEVIAVGNALISRLGFKGIKVRINSLGDEESRKKYHDALVEYFTEYKSDLCDDCQVRLEKNPLRILDCKIDSHKDYFATAPKIKDYLSEASKAHFNSVISALDSMNIEYVVDDSLVRGLDYYTETVFEISADIEGFGAQNVICGGGRYNNLVKELGGPDTPAVGMAFGLERLLLALEYSDISIVKEKHIHVYFMTLGEKAKEASIKIINNLRYSGLVVDCDYNNRSFKSQFKQSDKANALYTVIFGEDELNNKQIKVKDNDSKEQVTIPLSELRKYLVLGVKDKYKRGI